MSENMIGDGDMDALAAEYVLGTLDFDERSAAQSLLTEDVGFAAKVKVWERRLGELHLMVEPVEPEPDIWQRIKAKLPEVQPDPVSALAVIEPELELKPELELTPDPELKSELALMPDPGLEPAPEGKPESEPAIIAAESVPVSRDAPPAAPDATALPSWQPAPVQTQVATPATATVKPPVGATGAPVPPVAALPTARSAAMVERDEKLRVTRRRLARWRTVAVLMTLAVFAVAALLALWIYVPERVPPVLRPLELMRLVGITIDTASTLREPAPPESQFDE
jgi:anti-sigma-K factor RskA